jgi:ribosomal protein S27E
MDLLARFSRVWCPTCNKMQPMIFDVMKANDKNDHDAADIVCNECKSVIATLHGPRAHRAGVRTGRAEKARAMAGQEIDRLMTHQQPTKNDNSASGGFSRGPKSSEMFAANGAKEGGDEHAANSLYLPRRYLDT